MSQEIEKEVKTALSFAHYTDLHQHFQCAARTLAIQHNYYFDSLQQTLKQQHIALRLRRVHQQNELTLKRALTPTNALEVTDLLSDVSAQDFLNTACLPTGEVADYLAQLFPGTLTLQQIGYLKNERYTIQTPEGLWALDMSHFPTGIAYELEFEYQDDATPFFTLLADFGIPYQKTTPKIARALMR